MAEHKSVKVIKRVGSVIKNRSFQEKSKEKLFLNLIKNNRSIAYYRKGNFSHEIVWDGNSYSFPKKGTPRSFKQGLFLFAMVRRDAKNFIKSGRKLKIPRKFPVNEYVKKGNRVNEKLTGTDLNHAYWRIAMNLGIISHKTYERGLDDSLKVVRLAALSTLGKGKDYYIIRDGEMTEEIIKIGIDEELDLLYKVIRYTCYKYMQQVKRLLKDDFIAYKTDCVYYVDTPQNRKLVKCFFTDKKMSIKQLTSIKKTLHG